MLNLVQQGSRHRQAQQNRRCERIAAGLAAGRGVRCLSESAYQSQQHHTHAIHSKSKLVLPVTRGTQVYSYIPPIYPTPGTPKTPRDTNQVSASGHPSKSQQTTYTNTCYTFAVNLKSKLVLPGTRVYSNSNQVGPQNRSKRPHKRFGVRPKVISISKREQL